MGAGKLGTQPCEELDIGDMALDEGIRKLVGV